jgi:subtilisin family serine protease
VDPTITPARFWSLALQTGRTIQIVQNGQTFPLGPIVAPVALTNALTAEITFPKIDRRPPPANFTGFACRPNRVMTSLPHYDPNSTDPWQLDLRNCDLSQLDLHDRLDDLLYASFDTRTSWPSADRMPAGFDPTHILELGKNPGLDVRSLHARGITGHGVGIAIIDQVLLVDHPEYADHLQLYEEININPTWEADMHGPAVASIAVGKTVGVAPEAKLYYIASQPGDSSPQGFTYNWVYEDRA